MKKSRCTWIKKVVISKHPVIMEMMIEKFGEETANQLTYNQVIKTCKKMWNERRPGVEKWTILKEEVKEN